MNTILKIRLDALQVGLVLALLLACAVNLAVLCRLL